MAEEVPQEQQNAIVPDAAPSEEVPQEQHNNIVLDAAKPSEVADPGDVQPDIGFSENELRSLGHGIANKLTFGNYEKQATEEPAMPGLGSILPPENKQSLEKIKKENPTAYEVGQGIGGAALLGAVTPIAGAVAAEAGIPAAIAQLPKWGQVGARLIKTGSGFAALQSADEITHALHSDKANPAPAVSSALANVGSAFLLGAGTEATLGTGGGLLKAIKNSKVSDNVSKVVSSMGNQAAIEQGVSDPAKQLYDELSGYHGVITNAMDDVQGAKGLKSQAIEKLAQNITPDQVASHVNEIRSLLSKVPKSLENDELYKARLANWEQTVTPTTDYATGSSYSPSPSDVFKATESFKKDLGEWSAFTTPTHKIPRSELPIVYAARSLGHGFKESLENVDNWGDLGRLQKGINKSTAEMIPALKDYNSGFTQNSEVEGGKVTTPGKVNTFYNQLGKPQAEFNQDRLNNFIDAGDRYMSQYNNLHTSLGLEAPLPPAPINYTRNAMDKDLDSGAKLVRSLYRVGIPKVGGSLAIQGAGALTGGLTPVPGGATIGALAGQSIANKLIPVFEAAVGRPVKKYMIPAMLRAAGANKPQTINSVIDYASKINTGSNLVDRGVNNLFTAGGQQAHYGVLSDKDKEKIKKFTAQGGTNSQIQNTLNSPDQAVPAQPVKPPGFAEGGVVEAPESDQSDVPSTPYKSSEDDLAEIYPAHNIMLQAARSRIYNYLNAVRPQDSQTQLPYDIKPNQEFNDDQYDKAVNYAGNPLSILNKVKDGSISHIDMTHFIQLHPDLHDHLSNKITKKITEDQLNRIDVPYKTRQGLSIFLGTPLDSTMTPSGIIAAQMSFAQPQPQQGPQAPQQQPKKQRNSPSSLGKTSKAYMTPLQSAESDRSSRE